MYIYLLIKIILLLSINNIKLFILSNHQVSGIFQRFTLYLITFSLICYPVFVSSETAPVSIFRNASSYILFSSSTF
jgi:hypothetical protein